jgi:putative aldouronate transport system permease protein
MERNGIGRVRNNPTNGRTRTAAKKNRLSTEDFFVSGVAYTFCLVFVIATLFPFMNVVSKALSANWAVNAGKVGIIPVDINLDNIVLVASSNRFLNSLKMSIIITVTGAVFAIVISSLAAYPLSKRHMPFMKPMLLLYIAAAVFNPPLIPRYMLVYSLGLVNTIWAVVLPSMTNILWMLIIKNYFESLPESIEESARVDGAKYFTIFRAIVIPISTPVIATVVLFYAVFYWNDYFGAMIFLTKTKLKPLQLYLREMVLAVDMDIANLAGGGGERVLADEQMITLAPAAVRSAAVLLSTIPILLVYPFLQRYFVKGIIIGSVKG